MRWRDALDSCKSRLAEEDRKIAESIISLEAVLQDLDERQKVLDNTWMGRTRIQLIPFLKCLQTFTAVLVVTMLPHSIETSLAWGLVSIVLRLGLSTEQRSRKLFETLDSIRKTLRKVHRYVVTDLSNNEEVKEALIDLGVRLLEFLVKFIKELRKHPLEKIMDTALWKDISVSLKATLEDIEEYYETIRDLAESNSPTRALTLQQKEPSLSYPILALPVPSNPLFFGREDILERIHNHLNPTTRQHKLPCFTIYGMGGVGKTQVATTYAYRYCGVDDSSTYDLVLWIASETRSSLEQSFYNIASALKLPDVSKQTDPTTVVDAVQTWLKETDKRWLLIYDNAEKWSDLFSEFWPKAGAVGAAIVTSRDFNLANRPASAGEELRTFNQEESWEFAESILTEWDSGAEDERSALKELLSSLDGLPLAIHQIISLINAEGSSLTGFVDVYKDHTEEYHKHKVEDHEAFYSHSLETVWRFAINKASQSADSQLFLGAISMLSPDSIPEKLFYARKDLDLPESSLFFRDVMHVRKLTKTLRSQGLIRVSRSNIRIHRLLQSAFLQRLDNQVRNDILTVTATLLNDIFPKTHLGDPLHDRWEICSTYILHVQSLAKRWLAAAKKHQAQHASSDFLELLSNAARYLREIGSYNGALELVDIGLTLSGGDHEIRIANLVNIGGIASERLLQLDQARKYYERALEIRARILGDGHQETCGMKQNLACVTAGEGQYGLALQLFEAAEKGITMSTPQEKRLATHRFAANYGRCLIRLGEFEKARENLVRGREILDSGKDVPIYRRSLEYCFGNLNLAEKRLDDAKVNYQTCLTAFPDHILGKNQRVLSCGCHYKLARIAMEQGDFDSARDHIDEALALAQRNDSQGYIGRILLLKRSFIQAYDHGESGSEDAIRELSMRIEAIRLDLESLLVEYNLEKLFAGRETQQNPDKLFEFFITWQTR